MALTVTNVNTLSLLNILNRTSTSQSDTLTRLSTGNRINRGQDDPAGLLALNGLESELTGVNSAITANQRTDAIMSVADSALDEVSSLLKEIQSLAASSSSTAGMTASELSANQSQIDNAISSIDRIIRTTQFNGKKLLDGSLGIDVSGVDATELTDIRVYARNPSSDVNTLSISVVSAAHTALTGTTTASAFMTNSASEATTVAIRGSLGTQIIEIAADENLSSVVSKINDLKAQTGVSAILSGYVDTGAIQLSSTGYGSAQFVKVSVLEGGSLYSRSETTVTETRAVDVDGQDADVRINGHVAGTDGKEVYYNSNGLELSFKLTDALNTAAQSAVQSTSFTVDDSGGATFQLGTDSTTQATIGISGLFSQELGTGDVGEVLSALKSGGDYDLLSDPAKAADIAAAALKSVSTQRGRIGGFQKYQVQTAMNSMMTMKESLSAVKSSIADVDYAVETAELSKQNVLIQSAISLLGLANQQSAQVLSLL
ncbi:MAG: flagellin [Phycisphaerae bacterium]|jgi:flagellin